MGVKMQKQRNHAWLSGLLGLLIGTSVFAAIPQGSGVATHSGQASLYASWPVTHARPDAASASEIAMQQRVIAAAQEAFMMSAHVR
ncbi:hypothetical protein FHS89_002774 [Rubricella aquisinus]|uniref:Uncharacterized protein n=1 Tax=Rubricella aquisinus TaxID=2028108 RepID=A0A840X1S8_9RHOB|nr:hypothetical protein [Rubricella aquisinus]MBB5516734.1 hypothetical protein [Rubricella aquisinus]